MKLSNINVKGAAAAAVLAGTMAFAPVSALALGVSAGDTGASKTITKNWTVASEQQFDENETFTFQLTYDHAGKVGTNDYATPTGEGGVSISGKELTKNGLVYSGTKTLSDVLSDVDFSKPGQYYFNLTETDGDNQNIVYSKDSYQVRVDVVWDDVVAGTLKINDVEVLKDGKKAEAVFNNGKHDAADLTVEKKVSGTAANTEDPFDFTITLDGVTGEYTVVLPDGTTTTTNNGSWSGKLKHGQSVKIENLPVGAKYTVSEADTDYEESYVVDGASSVGGVTTGEQTVKQGGDNVTFTNKKGFAADTGITMNTIPYVIAGGVVVAGAATLVISRRRRAGEDF